MALGYQGTKEEAKRLIEDASKETEIMKELGITVDATDLSFANMAKGIAVIQKKMGITGTTMEEANDTLTGSMAAMKASVENLKSHLALGDVENAVNDMVSIVSTGFVFLGRNMLPMVLNIFKSLPKAFIEGAKKLGPMIPQILEEVFKGTKLEGVFTELFANLDKNGTFQSIKDGFSSIKESIGSVIDIVKTIGGTIAEALGFDSTKEFDIAGTIAKVAGAFAFGAKKVSEFIQAFKESAIFQGFLEIVSHVASKIIPLVQKAWTVIKTIINLIGAALSWLGSLFESEGGGLVSILKGIIDAIAMAWEGALNIIQGIAEILTALFNGDLDTALEGLKNLFVGAIQFIVGSLGEFIGKIIGIGSAIVVAIVSLLNNLFKIIFDGIGRIGEFLGGLKDKALAWGKDFLQGFINGIKEKISGVVNAVKGVGDKIKNFLHFSRPDEGPLRDYEKWMPDFMSGLAKGINDNKGKVLGEMQDLVSGMNALGMSANASLTTAGNVMNGNNRTYNINQSNNFTNSYNGEPGAAARQISGTMKKSANDATTLMAHGLAFARG